MHHLVTRSPRAFVTISQYSTNGPTMSRFGHRICQSFVIVQSLLVGPSGAVGLDPRPGNRKSIALHIELLGYLHIFLKAVVRITGDVAGVPSLYFAHGVRKAIPDRFALAVNVPSALDLVGSRGHAPDKILRKLIRNEHICSLRRSLKRERRVR